MNTIKHSGRAHALLSASGSKRWLTCTPSAKAEDMFLQEQALLGEKEPESEFAKQGTAAHEYSELLLSKELELVTKAQATRAINKFKKENPYYDDEMQDMIEQYVDYVMERVNAARAETEDALVLLEQRLDFSAWVPNGFGTGDVLIISDGKLEIIDLKYGKGVPVDAYENTQMMLYGLGATQKYDMVYDITDVTMTIVQPRLDSISSYSINAFELYKWADNYVKPKAQAAANGEGEFVAGEHCRFCKIKSTCRKRAEVALEAAKAEFADDDSITIDTPTPATLTSKEVAELLFVVDDIEKWCKDLKAYALEQAVAGESFDGFKLVEGRSNRAFTNEAKVVEILTADGIEEDALYTKKLTGLTNIEKTVGKARFNELLADYITKPQGKPTLVLETDKRPALNSLASATADFDE